MTKKENKLSQLILKLEGENLDYRKSSLLQGVLFEKMDSDYAALMHSQGHHPYSQYLSVEDGNVMWYINTLDNQAYDNIIEPLLTKEFTSFEFRHNDTKIDVIDKILREISYDELMNQFYEEKGQRIFKVSFRSLISFKQNGHYNILPDLRLIYQSLMMKYSAVSDNDYMIDEETLEQLVYNSRISYYKLFTGSFPLEGQKIPGYMGNITIKCTGTETMSRYIRLLLRFGEFSGVGVKTGMGMGAMQLMEVGKIDK